MYTRVSPEEVTVVWRWGVVDRVPIVEPAASHVFALSPVMGIFHVLEETIFYDYNYIPAVLRRLCEEGVVDVVVFLQRALLHYEGPVNGEYLLPNETCTMLLMILGAQLLRW